MLIFTRRKLCRYIYIDGESTERTLIECLRICVLGTHTLFGGIILFLLVCVRGVCLCNALIAVIAADKCPDVVFNASGVSQVATSTDISLIFFNNCCQSSSGLLFSPPSSKIVAK